MCGVKLKVRLNMVVCFTALYIKCYTIKVKSIIINKITQLKFKGNMKKFIAIISLVLVVSILAFSLAGCGSNPFLRSAVWSDYEVLTYEILEKKQVKIKKLVKW